MTMVASQRLYKVIVRLRPRWTVGWDTTVPEAQRPPEIEGASIEVDVTSLIQDFTRQHQREALSAEATFTVINERGECTPTNNHSELNWQVVGTWSSPEDGSLIETGKKRMFCPLFAEGNEIQIYRVPDLESLNNLENKENWIPRFRGQIHTVNMSVSEGVDSLEVIAGDVLARATRRAFSASWSPVMRTGSFIPGNSFYTLSRLVSAIGEAEGGGVFRKLTSSSVMYDPNGSRAGQSIQESGEIPANLLASLVFWDRDDYYYKKSKMICTRYFDYPLARTQAQHDADGGKHDPDNYALIPPTANTATSIFMLNGRSWFVSSGTVTKDTGNIFQDTNGSLSLAGATLRTEMYKVPLGVPSLLRVPVKLAAGESITVTISSAAFGSLTANYGTIAPLFTSTVTGPTTFNAATTMGGVLLNSDLGTADNEWRIYTLELPSTLIPSNIYDQDADFLGTNPTKRDLYSNGSTLITLVRVEISGTGHIDLPRWEFTSIDKDPVTEEAVVVDNNILAHPVFERWTTTDGITFKDPYPDHKVITKRMIRVVVRSLAAPYQAGTEMGFSPAHMYNRTLPSEWVYERDLVEGSDYEVLYDKGAIRLSAELLRGEVFVAHTYVDLKSSQHMEATNLIKKLLIHGAGIPEYQKSKSTPNIVLESTGILLSKVSVDVAANGSILQSLRGILDQVPANYYLFADGDARILGRFIRQSGSPRIYNPVVQVPLQPNTGTLEAGEETWYAVTALMPDGKETLPSNLVSTVEYQNYYDAEHKSILDGRSCPALRISPVPNQVGLVVRRATSSKPSTTLDIEVDKLTPYSAWYFDTGYNASGAGGQLNSTSPGFTWRLSKLVDILGTVK